MKCNPEADHNCIQPCMMIRVMRPLAESQHPLASAAWETVSSCMKTLFDVSDRNLCFGGYAPWERENPTQ